MAAEQYSWILDFTDPNKETFDVERLKTKLQNMDPEKVFTILVGLKKELDIQTYIPEKGDNQKCLYCFITAKLILELLTKKFWAERIGNSLSKLGENLMTVMKLETKKKSGWENNSNSHYWLLAPEGAEWFMIRQLVYKHDRVREALEYLSFDELSKDLRSVCNWA